MTYGVYTEDLKYISVGRLRLEECREYLSKGYVICSEKELVTGFEIKIQFHKMPRWRWCEWEKTIGFVSFEFRKLKYFWADKVVEEYKGNEVKQ